MTYPKPKKQQIKYKTLVPVVIAFIGLLLLSVYFINNWSKSQKTTESDASEKTQESAEQESTEDVTTNQSDSDNNHVLPAVIDIETTEDEDGDDQENDEFDTDVDILGSLDLDTTNAIADKILSQKLTSSLDNDSSTNLNLNDEYGSTKSSDYAPSDYDTNSYGPSDYDTNSYDANNYGPSNYDMNSYDANNYDANGYIGSNDYPAQTEQYSMAPTEQDIKDASLLSIDLPESQQKQISTSNPVMQELQSKTSNVKKQAEDLHDQLSDSINSIKNINQQKISQDKQLMERAYQDAQTREQIKEEQEVQKQVQETEKRLETIVDIKDQENAHKANTTE